MDENFVVEAVFAYLLEHGHRIEQRRDTTHQGIDIIAVEVSSGRRFYIEAKGATSSREGSARFGQGFTSSQIFDRVAKGVYTGLCLRSHYSDDRSRVALAFPDLSGFETRLEPIRQQLKDAGLEVFLVKANNEVRAL
jgi:hypothetical protein